MNIKAVGPACTLGEGPLWHPKRQELFWFDIPAGRLYASDFSSDAIRHWDFGEPASACGWVDDNHLIVATARGLQHFDIVSGDWSTVCPLEADDNTTRSNDGRIGPDGSFWIGTMGVTMTPRAGAYYRYNQGKIEKLFDQVSIPNATCFSPDGRTAYLADTRKQVIWRWPLDGQGNPVGEREVHINFREENINPDGAVCDSEGYLWNAQWGSSRVARYDPLGVLDRIIELPVSQPTCPAFGGPDLKTLYITSAKEHLSAKQLEKEPDAGRIFVIDLEISGIAEHRARL